MPSKKARKNVRSIQAPSRPRLGGKTKARAVRKRRKRRSRADVIERIRQAARQLFADRGFAATTTKEIALTADVSETLLFRHYGNKAELFDEVIASPINRMMAEFVALHKAGPASKARETVVRTYVTRLFDVFAENEELFRAAVATPHQAGGRLGSRTRGLEHYFDEAVKHLEMDYAIEDHTLGFDPRIAVRLAFGMTASAVLLRDWLFPKGLHARAAITKVLERMIMRALAPRRPR